MQSAYGREKNVSMAMDLWLYPGVNTVKTNKKIKQMYQRDTMLFW